MTQAQTEPLTPGARLTRELPGFIYRHQQTNQIVGVLSCDTGHFIEVMRVDGFVSEKHVKDIHNGYKLVAKTGLRAVRETLSDHAGEFATTFVRWSVGRPELLRAVQAVAGKVAA